jgi:hypothetical protein
MVKNCCCLKATVIAKFFVSQFLSFVFRKLTVLNMRSSWTLPRTITIAISATVMYSNNWCFRKLLASMLLYNRVKGLISNGFFIILAAFSFMHCINNVVCKSNLGGDRMGLSEPSGNAAILKGIEWPYSALMNRRCFSNLETQPSSNQYCG